MYTLNIWTTEFLTLLVQKKKNKSSLLDGSEIAAWVAYSEDPSHIPHSGSTLFAQASPNI